MTDHTDIHDSAVQPPQGAVMRVLVTGASGQPARRSSLSSSPPGTRSPASPDPTRRRRVSAFGTKVRRGDLK